MIMKVTADGGSQFPLTILMKDAIYLGLDCEGVVDGSFGHHEQTLFIYSMVRLTAIFSDGLTHSAYVTPYVIEDPTAAAQAVVSAVAGMYMTLIVI